MHLSPPPPPPPLPALSLLFSLLLLASSSPDELRSLLEFKKGIQSDPLGRVLTTWTQSSTSPRSFYGVVCNLAGNVTAISLDRLGLVGDLKFNTLINLKMLETLSLSGNSLTGRLVPALGFLSSLQHLDLSQNQFYGPIPARINDLWGLEYMNLSCNNFTGRLPDGIQNLQQLKVLDFHSNGLSGDIEELFARIRNVEYLDLSYNMFYGTVDLDLESVSSLANMVKYLNLSHNRLSGGFFGKEIVQLFRNLQVLDLGGNLVSGELPSFGSFVNLRVLRLGSNQLYGEIPVELLGSLIPLEELDLSDNGFSGPINVINSTSLSMLNISSNALSGSLPSTVGRCIIVDFSSNMLSGDVSAMQGWGSSLEILDLSSNKFSGSVPDLTSKFQNLTSLIMKNNSLIGILSPVLGSCPRLSTVDLSLNEFDGLIPASFFTSKTLTYLNLSGNHFTGSIPLHGSHTRELSIQPSYPPMESLDLSDNSLTGTLKLGIGELGGLKLLNLAKNGLSGRIPNALTELSVLEYLDLSRNNFMDKIPNKLPSSLKVFNVSYNDLSGPVPQNLRNFPITSFHPGNSLLIFPNGLPFQSDIPVQVSEGGKHPSSKFSIRVAIIASAGAAVMIAFVLFAYHRAQHRDFHIKRGLSGKTAGNDVKLGRFSKAKETTEAPPTSSGFGNDHSLNSNSRSFSKQTEFGTEIIEHVPDNRPVISERKYSSDSPVSSSPRFNDAIEQPVTLDVNSPDRLAGELFFVDASLGFTAEELSRAPAEVLGRSSLGTLYKATLDSGHVLTVKWLRKGLVKNKKEFAKEVKKIGSIRHPAVVPLRAYYWGPREQENLILADYVQGDSLGLHLYEKTPRRFSRLSFSQSLKVAVDVAQSLTYLHDRGLPHGNLKPTNILLAGPDLNACLTDYCLHRLMTPPGIAEQILNLGALGYCAPELATAAKPVPSLKSDVYAFGVILMELLTRKSAGDIISGQSGAVDLTDWVRLCNQEGRGMDCIDRDIASGEEENTRGMDELLALSLRCILPINERPNIRQVFEDLCSVTV